MCISMDDHEWETLVAIKRELDNNLMAYNSEAQERFTELLVMSLEGKGDSPLREV